MKEDLITFKTAKLAKEKGFEIPSARFYCTDGVIRFHPFSIFHLDEDEVDELEEDSILINDGKFIVSLWEDRNLTIGNILAPTQSLLQKWLREGHNINVSVRHVIEDYYICEMTFLSSRYMFKDAHKIYLYSLIGTHFKTYEEALEKGLQEALKLIRNK